MSCSNCKELISNLENRISELEKALNDSKSSNKSVNNSTQTEQEITTEECKKETSLIDMIKETSDTCMDTCGYVYDERTQLYYHKESGYYYDSATQLFFNPSNGYYYSYIADTGQYEYHSEEDMDKLEVYNRELIWMKGLQHKRPDVNHSNEEDAACIRFINEKNGDLHIVTCTGALLSTKTEMFPLILLIDESNAECTAQINYDKESSKYQINLHDCSTSDCFINSEILDKNVKELCHFDRLQLGNSHFYIHIHEDHGTCEKCEPGCLSIKDDNQALDKISDETNGTYHNSRRVIKNLKKKYGLYKPHKLPTTAKSYIDRAAIRRAKEKVDNKLCKQNKTIKKESVALTMMQNMGWTDGDRLGKDDNINGITEPISTQIRLNARAGLGSKFDLSVNEYNESTMKKVKMANKMKLRYENSFDSAEK